MRNIFAPSNQPIAFICAKVLSFPLLSASITTPFEAATIRSPEIANSRVRTHKSANIAAMVNFPKKSAFTNTIMMPSTMTLSMTASMKRPKMETWLDLRAM